jgi:hypothetical protein
MPGSKQTRRAKRFDPNRGISSLRAVPFAVWLMALGFFLAVVSLVTWGTPGVSLKPGDRADRDYIAKVRFECIDRRQTEFNRQQKRQETPECYSVSADGRRAMDDLRENLRKVLKDVNLYGAEAKSIASLPPPDRKTLAALAALIPAQQYENLLDFKGDEILKADDYQRVMKGPGKIAVVGEGEREAASDKLLQEETAGAYVLHLLQTRLAEIEPNSAPQAALMLAGLIKPEETLKPTLAYERALSEKAREDAALAVPPVYRTVLPGDAIIMRGKEIDEQHLDEIQAERKAYEASRTLSEKMERFGGAALLVLVLFGVGAIYLFNFQRNVFLSETRFFLFAALILLVMLISKVIVLEGWPTYLIPITLSAMVLTIAYTARTSLAVSWMLAAVIGLMAGMDLAVFLYLLAGGAVAAFGAAKIRRRSKIIKVGVTAGIAFVAVIWGEGLLKGYGYEKMLFNALLGMTNGVFVAFVISGILPFIEKWFGITTDISLLELSDQNHPLIRRLIFSAPGTYHHSLIVGNLAEEAAAAIGANALLARVGSYFHDIGKLSRPDYFIENEPVPGTKHSKLSTPMSTTIILAHTKDGVELSREYKLPSAVRAIIQQHHGTSILEYFYHEALGEFGGEGGVDESSFRYAGPRPQTREAGIVLLADACEAASRALSDPTVTHLENMTDEIIQRKMKDKQLDECNLTLTDLAKIRDSFVRILSARFHARVKYPEAPPAAKKDAEAAPDRQETTFYTRRRQFDV